MTATARLDGKVAWVTGGANGFGAGVSRRLASYGATVVVSDIDATNGERVARDVGGTFVACDVTSYDENLAAVRAVVDAHGKLDIAFLNAGIASGVSVGDDFTLAGYRQAMGVNLDGVVFGLHAALDAMKDRGGQIVATASLAGLTATPFDPLYGANKHASSDWSARPARRISRRGSTSTHCVRGSPTPTSSVRWLGMRSRASACPCSTSTVSSMRSSLRSPAAKVAVLVHPAGPRRRAVPVPQRPGSARRVGARTSDQAGDVQRTLTERSAH